MYDFHEHLQALAGQVHSEGGWGYTLGQAAHLEPTALALLALGRDPDRYAAAIAQGKQFLERCAQPDGTYRLGRGRPEAAWPTALVLFVQTVLDYPRSAVEQTASALLTIRGRPAPLDKETEIHDIDLSLVGWPWAEGNFSWAEPTAWACLALSRAGHARHERVQEGVQLLLDRASDSGGINYGNRRILGRNTEPILGPTALMLLALQDRGDHPRVAAAVQYLLGQLGAEADLENLCWARLSLDVHREQPGVAEALSAVDDKIVAALQERATRGWLRPSCVRLALTALALGAAASNPFRIDDVAPVAEVEPARILQSTKASRPIGERLRSAFQGLAIKAVGRLKPMPPQTPVHIARAADYQADLADVLGRQYEAFRERVPLKDRQVVLKPNLVEYHRDKVINTNPLVVAAVIELCRREGAREVLVAEGPGHCRNVEHIVQASGLADVLRHYGVPFVDLNHDEPVKARNLGRLTGLEHLYLARTIATADVLISLPKLKTHHWAGATLALKNLFGTLPGICYGWPKNELHWRGIDKSIVDIALTRTPDLAIVDGIVGMEGDGPLNGTPKALGALVMGSDPLAVDATCCRLMQLNPERIAYLGMGYQRKLGLLRTSEIQQIGESIESIARPFDMVAHFQGLYLGRSA